MDILIFKYLIFPIIPLILFCLVKVVYVFWWKPKRLEKYFREIGIAGSSYKLFHGDMEETKKLMAQTWSKPMPLNHAIGPRVSPFWHQMVKNYGRISLCWFGRNPRLVVANAELQKYVFNNKNGHFRIPKQNPLVNLLSLGVATMDGDQWSKRRKLITPAFHHDKIVGMLPAFLTSCCNLIERWNKKPVDSEGKFELDIAPEMQDLTLEVIAGAAFGTTFDEAKAIFELQKEQAVLVLEALFTFYFPGSRFLPTKKNRRRYEIDNKIKATLKDMILSKEKKMETGKVGDDLLSLLLQCQKQADNDMTIEDVIEECKLFYFAGQETTANWLTWTMIVLSMHPNWQEKAREEVLQVFGKRTPDVKTVNRLKTVSMILQEVLRLYPPVVNLGRSTIQSTQLGDMVIPAGVEITFPTLLIHHDPEYWGEDADEFKPERFAEGVAQAAKDDRTMAFYPFSWGPKSCLGQNFAMVEARLALTMILQHFEFELSPAYTHAPHTVLTLQPQHGAQLVLHQI